ncbi:MAG: hypothetical protein ACI94O_001991, partial [Octadecabacter sp.]
NHQDDMKNNETSPKPTRQSDQCFTSLATS